MKKSIILSLSLIMAVWFSSCPNSKDEGIISSDEISSSNLQSKEIITEINSSNSNEDVDSLSLTKDYGEDIADETAYKDESSDEVEDYEWMRFKMVVDHGYPQEVADSITDEEFVLHGNIQKYFGMRK